MSDASRQFESLKVGFLEVNCYLVPSEPDGRLYIIDPGASPDSVAAKAKTFGFDDYAVILTHAHIDHISGIPDLMEILPVSGLYLHPDDLKLYQSPANELPPLMMALHNPPAPSTAIDSADFAVIHTPGHTRGCVCYHFERLNAVFTGDTLFRESIGRTDLPGGDGDAIVNSIRGKLYALPDDLNVFPGHGAPTTILHEKRNNPYVPALN